MGLVLLSVRCAVNGHEAILYRDLGVNQFLVGWIVDNMNNPCFACTTLGAPGEVPHVQPQGTVLLVASPHTGYVYPIVYEDYFYNCRNPKAVPDAF